MYCNLTVYSLEFIKEGLAQQLKIIYVNEEEWFILLNHYQLLGFECGDYPYIFDFNVSLNTWMIFKLYILIKIRCNTN